MDFPVVSNHLSKQNFYANNEKTEDFSNTNVRQQLYNVDNIEINVLVFLIQTGFWQ